MPQVLIVDDEQVIITLLNESLKHHNFECFTANNGKDALDILESKSIDLLIADIIMPSMNGLTLIRKAKKAHKDMPIIAMSGGGRLDAENYLQSAEHIGASKIFEKPFDINELVHCCKTLTDSVGT